MAIVTCSRCGRQAEGLARAPLAGQTGQAVLANVCAACWREWSQESVNLINHMGLQPVDPADRVKLRELMRDFLKIPAEVS